jgi:CubicO group peptidase (beta-lactamase class C family)
LTKCIVDAVIKLTITICTYKYSWKRGGKVVKGFLAGSIVGVILTVSAVWYGIEIPVPELINDDASAPNQQGQYSQHHLDPLGQEIDAMISKDWPEDEPGLAIIVTKGEETILRKGYGLADLEHGIPIEPNTVFRLGSISKQFAAVAILLLEQDGLLKVTDDIRVHLPDYPTHGELITIEHLLTHTSGIPNYTALEGFFGPSSRLDNSTVELMEVFKDLELEFKPGTRFSYSNSGYLLLGAIIEAVSDKTYANFVNDRIFQPLGMSSSYYGSNVRLIPNRARGYDQTEVGYQHSPYLSMTIPHAAGALLSTIEDLNVWQNALLAGDLIPLESLERAWTSGVLQNEDQTGYGYGWGIGYHEGLKVVTHDGGINGFSTYGVSFPNEQVYVAVLSNNPYKTGTSPIARVAASAAAGKPLDFLGNEIEVSPEILERYVGSYQFDPSTVGTVTLEDGNLLAQIGEGQKQRLAFYSETEFVFEGTTTKGSFEVDEEVVVTSLMTTRWAMEPSEAPKLEP